MNIPWISALITTLLFLSGTYTYAETQWRLGVNLGSYHIESTGKFDEFNPGAFISVTFKSESRLQLGLHFGGYANSYGDRTLYGLGFANYRIRKYDEAELFIGGFSGFFEYPNLVEFAKSAGIPTIDNMVFIAGPTLTYRLENGVDFTFAYIPFRGRETNGILTFQSSIPFAVPSY